MDYEAQQSLIERGGQIKMINLDYKFNDKSWNNDIVGLVEHFQKYGFVVVREAFSKSEMNVLKDIIDKNDVMQNRFKQTQEKFKSGKYPSFESIFVWQDTSGTDVFSKISRSYKVFPLVAKCFDDLPYVYHNKAALKYPEMPGFKYHQDYFYWYTMGCLFSDMASAYFAIDKSNKENGCLKIVPQSHTLGRVDHVLYDNFSDSEVDPIRQELCIERFGEVHIELDPGDYVLFHANTFHGSEANLSDASRLSLLGCYNTKRNDPFIRSNPHPNYIEQHVLYDNVVEEDITNQPDYSMSYAEKS